MAIQVKHKFVSAKVDTLDNSRVQPSNWNDTHDLLIGPAVVIGRGAGAGQAAAAEIPMGVTGQALLATATAAAARAAIVADDSQTTIGAAAAKVTPVDADVAVILDSAAANVFKRVTWANIKATLKAYFDTLYPSNVNGTFTGTVTALQNFVSSTVALVLATTGAGTIYLRPNGAASAVGQGTMDAAGNLNLSGYVNGSNVRRNGVALPFTDSYESAPQVVTAGGLLTLAHGLGVKPKLYQAYAICQVANAGYAIGEEVLLNPSIMDAINGNRGLAIVPDAVNIVVRIGATGGSLGIIDKSNGAGAFVSNANWKLVIRAWA